MAPFLFSSLAHRFFPWFVIIGVPLIGLGLLWAVFFMPAWPAWALIAAGFLSCLPVWLEWVWQELPPRP